MRDMKIHVRFSTEPLAKNKIVREDTGKPTRMNRTTRDKTGKRTKSFKTTSHNRADKTMKMSITTKDTTEKAMKRFKAISNKGRDKAGRRKKGIRGLRIPARNAKDPSKPIKAEMKSTATTTNRARMHKEHTQPGT